MFGRKPTMMLDSTVGDLSKQEKYFIAELSKSLTKEELQRISINRLSNNYLNFEYNGMQIGRIKLTGRKHTMQLLTGQTNISSIDGDIDYFIAAIPIWIVYIRKEL